LNNIQRQPGFAFHPANEFIRIVGAPTGLGRDQPHARHFVFGNLGFADPQRLNRTGH